MSAAATIANVLISLALVAVTIGGWAARRLGREARRSRREQQMVIAAVRYTYRIQLVAARHGWDTHPEWPELPKELGPDYLDGDADRDDKGGGTWDDLAGAMQNLTKGTP